MGCLEQSSGLRIKRISVDINGTFIMSKTAIKNVIPLSEPEISGNEWKYIKECLDTGWVSSVGSYVTRFEEMVANYVGTKYAVATVNGTSALHISLIACGLQPGE